MYYNRVEVLSRDFTIPYELYRPQSKDVESKISLDVRGIPLTTILDVSGEIRFLGPPTVLLFCGFY